MDVPQVALKNLQRIEAIDRGFITAPQQELPYKMTTGEKNVLFHYVSYNGINGLLLSPLQQPKLLEYFSIRQTFWRTAIMIRKILLHQACQLLPVSLVPIFREENGHLKDTETKAMEFGIKISNELEPCWVVGRLYEQKELYVCFADGTPQSMVELAFKLQFGVFS